MYEYYDTPCSEHETLTRCYINAGSLAIHNFEWLKNYTIDLFFAQISHKKLLLEPVKIQSITAYLYFAFELQYMSCIIMYDQEYIITVIIYSWYDLNIKHTIRLCVELHTPQPSVIAH